MLTRWIGVSLKKCYASQIVGLWIGHGGINYKFECCYQIIAKPFKFFLKFYRNEL